MLSFNELKKGQTIAINSQPYEIKETSFLSKGRGSSVSQAKLKNLITGNLISKTFHPSDGFEEIQIEKVKITFLYSHHNIFWFSIEKNPKERFSLVEEVIGQTSQFLKPNQTLVGKIFKGNFINISLPIKVNLEVKESPPGVKGDRAQGGTKIVTLETGAKVNVPLFIEKGNIIEVNTENGQYTKRIERV